MAPRKRRGKGRLKGQPTSPHGANTHGFATLADEIYLEILFYIPSVPIPTSIDSESYPDIRRSRHETLLSLSQTSRSLRRFFWRYLWQRIEVREGMKIWDEDGTLTNTPYLSESGHAKEHKNYATELVRQLEIVTIRNPQLAQYVKSVLFQLFVHQLVYWTGEYHSYLDMLIGGYSIATVLTELARCLALFPNLHTVQIDVCLGLRQQSKLDKRFERTFKKYSYPQIRNVFISFYSVSFIASCPQARRVGLTGRWMIPRSCLQIMMDKCPHLEVLDLPELRTSNDCKCTSLSVAKVLIIFTFPKSLWIAFRTSAPLS